MRGFRLPLMLALAGVLLTGCGGGGANVASIPDPVVRFINAAPGSTALDFRLNESVVGNNVPYKGSTQTFATFESGDYDVSVQEDANPETQAIETLLLLRETNQLVVATGLVTPPNEELEKRLRLTDIQFDRRAPNGDRARLIVVHGYVRAAGLDTPNIDFQEPGDNPRFVVRNINFGNAQQLELDAGSQTLVARRSGSEGEVTPRVTFNFGAGKIYAAIVSGIEDSAATPPQITFIELQTR